MGGADGAAVWGRRLDGIVEGLLYALLAFMPVAFGAVEAWSEQVVIGLAGAMAACLAVRQVVGREPLVWTWAYVPAAVFVLLVVMQAVPLPVGLVGAVSPGTATLKTELLADVAGAGNGAVRMMTLSFYPHTTWRQWRVAVAAVSVFLVAIHVLRTRRQMRRLLWVIVGIGAATAALAVAQIATGATRIYWRVAIPRPAALGGPFVHHSHFAQFMNLSIGAGVALLLWGRRGGGWSMNRSAVLTTAFMVLAVGSVFLSLSRGGVISLLVAVGLVGAGVSRRRWGRRLGWVLGVVGVGALLAMVYVGFDAVWQRMGTLADVGRAQGGRVELLRDVMEAWRRFPVVGTGLGTHAVVFPMFDRGLGVPLAAHAENEYAQALEETGVVGFGCLAVFGALVLGGLRRCVRSGDRAMSALGVGLGFGLVAVLIHSAADFGQHVPANLMVSVVFCALLIRAGTWGYGAGVATDAATDGGWNVVSAVGRKTAGRADRPLGMAGRLGWLVPAGLALIGVWNCVEADAARRAERHWAVVRGIERVLEGNGWAGDNAEYERLIRHAQAAELQPGDVHYAYGLNVYRWRSTQRYMTAGQSVAPAVVGTVERLIAELRRAAGLCPTYGPMYCVLGQLEQWLAEHGGGMDSASAESGVSAGVSAGSGGSWALRAAEFRVAARRDIARALRLAPNNPTVCYVAGRWAVGLDGVQTVGAVASSGAGDSGDGASDGARFAAGIAMLNRAVALDGGFFEDVGRLYVLELGQPGWALELAGDDAWRLVRVADWVSGLRAAGADSAVGGDVSMPGGLESARRVERAVFERLAGVCERDDAPADVLAVLGRRCAEQEQTDRAIALYERALRLDYGNVDWRLRLARLYAERGDVQQGLRHTRVCLRLRPGWEAARSLAAELARRSGGSGDADGGESR